MNVSGVTTSPFNNSFKMVTLLAPHTGQVKKTSGRKRIWTTERQREPWYDGSDWHDTEVDEHELHSEGTDLNENLHETDDYGTDDIFSALLDQPVETYEGQEAAAAASAAADMSRRTWTQARQLKTCTGRVATFQSRKATK